jgi:hypothetical protein
MPALRSPHPSRGAGSTPSRPWLVRSALAALLVASAVGLAACGGGSGSPAAATTATIPTTTTTTTGGAAAAGGPAGGANRAAFTKYTTCLKQHGVTLPSFGNRGGGGGGTPPAGGSTTTTPRNRGGFGGGAFNNPKFTAARTACAKLLPAGFAGGFGRGRGGGGFGGNSAAFAAYRNCLTLHGVKLAAGAGGFGRRGAAGVKPTAKQQAALKACASLRPKFTRPPAGTSTNPNSTTTS